MTKRGTFKSLSPVLNIAFFTALLWFSFYLMFHTFSYDHTNYEMKIASKAWSDFGAHIPLIRSFSLGPNLTRLIIGQPVESPLFPGEPIRYHFGFYALAGALERLGIPIDLALNIPSALGFFLLIYMIFTISGRIFRSVRVGILSVIFFLFNGSLSFLRFFEKHPINPNTLTDIITNERFPSFGPWDGNTISAFWTLNIYTNQRHLGLSYCLVLVLIFLLLFPPARLQKHALLHLAVLSVITSALLFLHFPAAAIFGVFATAIFIAVPPTRRVLLFLGILSLPTLFMLLHVSNTANDIVWQPGYLAKDFTMPGMFKFWFDNIGPHLFLIPLGLFLAGKHTRRIFTGPLLVLFILPNLFRFSTDMINNHKFFNFFLIIGAMFSAYALDRIGQMKLIGRIGLICLLFFSTFSGIIDLFPIINDTRGAIADVQSDTDAMYIFRHTKPDAVIANSTWFYHPASVAGRSLFSGYTYFTWSYGYNQNKRESEQIQLYRSPDLPALCKKLQKQNVQAIELSENPEQYLAPNMDLWNSLTPDYTNPQSGRKIYITDHICRE